MPIYEYVCLDCGERYSLLVRSLSSPVTPACSRCGSSQARKLVSPFVAHGLDCQVDSYTGGDDSDLIAPGPPAFGRRELEASQKLRERPSDT